MYASLHKQYAQKKDAQWHPIFHILSWKQIAFGSSLLLIAYLLFRLGNGFPPSVWRECKVVISGEAVTSSFAPVLFQSFLYLVSWLLLLLAFLHTIRPRHRPSRWRASYRWNANNGEKSSARHWRIITTPLLLQNLTVAAISTFLTVAGRADARLWFPILLIINMLCIIIITRLFGEIGVALITVIEEWGLVISRIKETRYGTQRV